MRPHVQALRPHCDITLVANGSADDVAGMLGNGVSFVPVRIERRISLVRDCLALLSLWLLFRRGKFDCVHSIMPKSGLLAMIAARLAGVPTRFHTFTGQVWATRTGFSRWLLRTLDKVLAANATMALADSPSQRAFVLGEKVAEPRRIRVLADGSICGVDLDRFAFDPGARRRIRAAYGIPEEAFAYLFLGRLNRDKGIPELLAAFERVVEAVPSAHLIVAGPDEANLDAEVARVARRFPGRVHRIAYAERPEDFLSASDALCLPSHREGFANVIIEAAAAGVPSIASEIYGVTDAVEKGVTGLLHQPRSVPTMVDAMLRMLNDRPLRESMGAAARARAERLFSEKRITAALVEFYREMGALARRAA